VSTPNPRADRRPAPVAAVARFLRERLVGYPDVRLVVALSGGADSVALLAALAQLQRGHARRLPALRAVHVDHGLSPRSRDWARHCRALCGALGVPIVVRRVVIAPGRGESLEACARRARYAALYGAMRRDEVLLTAHQLDDQLETLLLQLLRGSGVAGLTGIPADVLHAGRRVLRPLLSFRRADLEAHARSLRLAPIDDESNRDLRFDRNYLRHRVLPAIEARWPAAARVAARSAAHLAEARTVLDELARGDAVSVARGDALDLTALARLPPPRRALCVRAWIGACGLPPPDAGHVARILGELPAARADANPAVAWPGAIVRRYRGALYCEALPAARAATASGRWRWDVRRPLELGAGLGRLVLRRDPRGGVQLAARVRRLQVRFPAKGERLVPAAGTARFRLAERMRASGVLPWRRAALPLVFAAGRCVAVAGAQHLLETGSGRSQRANTGRAGVAAQPGTRRFRLEWRDGPRVLAEPFGGPTAV
jgi:tRNA(Ile)-lysidine synthase